MFLVLKLLYFVKWLVFPIIDTVREYKRKRRMRREQGGEHEEIHRFWHNPLAAVIDRRFWVKLTTNAAETAVHATGSMRWMYGLWARRFRRAYQTWNPHHIHEHELYDFVEGLPWPVVRGFTWRWLKRALSRYENHRRSVPEVSNLSPKSKRWKKIQFDGMVIAAWVPNSTKPIIPSALVFRRKQWRLTKQVLSVLRAGCFKVRVGLASVLRRDRPVASAVKTSKENRYMRLVYSNPTSFELQIFECRFGEKDRVVRRLEISENETKEVPFKDEG